MARIVREPCAAQSNCVAPWESTVSRHRRRRTWRCARVALATSAGASTAALTTMTVRSYWRPMAMLSTAAAKQRSAPLASEFVGRRAHSGNWCGRSWARHWETLQARESESTWSPQHRLGLGLEGRESVGMGMPPGSHERGEGRRVLRSRDRVQGSEDRVFDRRITAASRGRSGGSRWGPSRQLAGGLTRWAGGRAGRLIGRYRLRQCVGRSGGSSQESC